jgi:hypothetical protein
VHTAACMAAFAALAAAPRLLLLQRAPPGFSFLLLRLLAVMAGFLNDGMHAFSGGVLRPCGFGLRLYRLLLCSMCGAGRKAIIPKHPYNNVS